ncbi:MAG: radical SAM protein [Myxococcota bacterium]|nr:radical SAM protein [Myxococcota bacterium]
MRKIGVTPHMIAGRDVGGTMRQIRRVLSKTSSSRLSSNALVKLNVLTGRTWALPILFYSPTSRCNSRCVTCDWWRSNGASDLTHQEVAALCEELPGLRTKLVVFTGGEPLLRADMFELADLFLSRGIVLHLLTSGLSLERYAQEIVTRFSAITVSLDGHTADLYRRVRGVDGLGALERGVRRIKELRPDLPVSARSTLHQRNFRALPELIDKAEAMGLDQISFLAADVSSRSFGRGALPVAPNTPGLLLEPDEVEELEVVIEKALLSHARSFRAGRVVERGDRLRRLGRYYAAQQGRVPFPEVRCHAPWASAVVEADGTLRPCFFQPSVGNIRKKSLHALLDHEMLRFRRALSVPRDATCQRCVCSLRVGLRTRVW